MLVVGLSADRIGRRLRLEVFAAAFELTAFFLISSSTPGHSQAMTLPGQFAVGPTGAATYTVPIAVPPGTAGMAPSLSLDYSSQNGNGLLGIGWTLSGLPSIGRCPRTMAQDGVVGGINYDANDRFCMEGQRLVAISGTYGADGAEYRTEIDSYSRILSHGTAGTGPAWFEVHTKSGQVMEFGHTADSQILAQGKTTARSWAVDKVSDSKGNYFTVTYVNDATNGQAYPSRVDYTGNAAANVATYNSVQFAYATRSDIIPQYQAGSLSQTTERLTDVKTYAGVTLVADYQISYQQSSTSGQSEISSIRLCSGNGACLPATSFGMDSSAPGNYNLTSFMSSDTCATCGIWQYGDVNGDGKLDIIHIANNSGFVVTSLSEGNGQYSVIGFTAPWDTCLLTCGTWQVGDVNGDGRTDLIHMAGNGFVITWLSEGNGQYNAVGYQNTGDSCFTCGTWQVGDVNGDGMIDLIHLAGNGLVITWLSNGSGQYSLAGYSNTGDSCFTCGTWQVGDVNGDGKTDLIHMAGDGLVITWLSSGNGQYSLAGYTSPGDTCFTCGTWQFGDVNGDGKIDLIHIANNAGFVITWLSEGNGQFSIVGFTAPWDTCLLTCGNWQIGDFNGDGRADLMHMAGNGFVITWLSQGNGQYNAVGYQNTGDSCFFTCGTWVMGDVDGDGKTDMLHNAGAAVSGLLITWFSRPASNDLMLSTLNGLGASTNITYQPLTSSGIYSKDSTAVYPVMDIQGALRVVSRVDTSNGLGGTYSSTYAYAGAKLDLSGRGFLGFRQTSTTDLQTNIVQTTTYGQSFPYIGLMGTTTKTLNTLTLNQTTNTYQFSNASGAATLSSPTLTSAPYRVSVAQSVAQSADLDRSAIPTATTSYQYDAYGNATQVVVSTPDGFSKSTANTYTNDTTNWFLGRLTAAAVTSVSP